MEKNFIDAYTTSDIIYKWDRTAVTIDKDAKNILPNFRISAFENKSCDSTTNTGNSFRHCSSMIRILDKFVSKYKTREQNNNNN